MVALTDLWLPILLAAVFVFIASTIIHMLPLWHRNDFPALPQQDGVQAALRPFSLPHGDFMLPRAASGAEMRSPEYLEKVRQGPVVIGSVMPGAPSMGRNIVLWFLFTLAISLFCAYVTGRALGPGREYLEAFRFAGTTAFLGYSVAGWVNWIWWGRSLKLAVTETIDGLIYALLTGGVFGWLWPGA